jgi:hypothetical protein
MVTTVKRVGYEVVTSVVMKSTVFWDITPCSPLNVNRRFGGTYRLHFHGRRIIRARNQCESKWQAPSVGPACHLLSRWFLARLILRPWKWRRYAPPKHRLAFNGLHCVISQKIALFNNQARPQITYFGRMLRYTPKSEQIENDISKLRQTRLPFWITWNRPIQFQFVLKTTIFRDMMPCSSEEVPSRFGGTYCLHILTWKIEETAVAT